MSKTWTTGALALAVLCASSSCQDAPPPAQCQDIPGAGCPEDNGADACSDPTCAAVYACQGGDWVFIRSCPGYSADAQPGPVEASAEASTSIDATTDVQGAYGGPGCTDLETPDCSLGTALACANTTDCCGCVDVYVCQQGGWNLWGACTDGGVVAQH